jgi:hypothetical protein
LEEGGGGWEELGELLRWGLRLGLGDDDIIYWIAYRFVYTFSQVHYVLPNSLRISLSTTSNGEAR